LGTSDNSALSIRTNNQERIRVLPNGNIGVNYSTPQFKLELRGNNPDDAAIIEIANSDESHFMRFFGGRQNDALPFIMVQNGDPLRLGQGIGVTSFQEYLRINSDGTIRVETLSGNSNVGDGTGYVTVNTDGRLGKVAALPAASTIAPLVDAVQLNSTAEVNQNPPPGATIIYIPLSGLSYTFTVPAGQNVKVQASAFGTAYALNPPYRDCLAQYQFHLNGTPVGMSQRILIPHFSSEFAQTMTGWSISHLFDLAPGTYTIEVRGAHAGSGSLTRNVTLVAQQGFVGEAAMNLLLIK
jgi:hypothetical protein